MKAIHRQLKSQKRKGDHPWDEEMENESLKESIFLPFSFIYMDKIKIKMDPPFLLAIAY